jgi:hypothetical protein
MKLKLIISLFIISNACLSQTVFNKMADFKKVSAPYPQTVLLLGYYGPNDGANGTFVFIDSSTRNPNEGTVMQPDDIAGAGRYLRLCDREINVLWFGAKRDGITDASAAINSALTAAIPIKNNSFVSTYGYGKVIIPGGAYKMSSPIIINNSVTLEGEGSGMFPYQETRLIYDGNVSGIIIKANNSNGGGRMVNVRNLYLRNFGVSTDSTKNGFFTNTRATVENVAIDNFGGNGFMVETNDSGNANNSTFINITGYYNAKNGFFCSGNESNNMGVYNSNFQANGMCGVLDRSFLGNMFYACHTSSNGLRAATGYNRSWCTYGGKVYQSIFYTSQKGVEPTVAVNWKNYWIEMPTVFSTVSPALWNADSTYWITGSYVIAGPAATSSLFGCYSEGGQGANQMNQFSMCIGGDHGAAFANRDNIYLNPSTSQLSFKSGAGVKMYDKDSTKTFVGMHNTFGVQIGSEKATHGNFQEKYFEATRTAIKFADNSTGNQSYSLIGKGYDPAKIGLVTLPRTGMLVFPYYSGYYIGDVNNGNIAANFISSKTGPPTTGTWAVGTICFNNGLDSTVYGWKCILRGPPSQWQKIKTGN